MNGKSHGRSYHHGDLKRSLIEAGEDLLSRKGVSGLSLREVAKAAGVSHSAPYRHFRDKADLLAAIAQRGFETMIDAESELLRSCTDPGEQFVRAYMDYVIVMAKNPERTKLMFGGIIDMKVAPPPLKQSAYRAFQGLVRIVRNCQDSGIFQEGETLELAFTAWTGMHGLALLTTSGFLDDYASTSDQVRNLSSRLANTLLQGMSRGGQ